MRQFCQALEIPWGVPEKCHTKYWMKIFRLINSIVAQEIKSGHYRVRTCDLFNVNEARYHCAKCPWLLHFSILFRKNNPVPLSGTGQIRVLEPEFLAFQFLV